MFSYDRAHPDLRPYLAIGCGSRPVTTAGDLEKTFADKRPPGPVILAMLDGSQKRCEYYQETRTAQYIDSKDDYFYRTCCQILWACGVWLLDRQGVVQAQNHQSAHRIWQDACIGCLPIAGQFLEACLIAGVVHKQLQEQNRAHGLNWENEFHACISIGNDFTSAIQGLRHGRADLTAIDADCWSSISPEARRTLTYTRAVKEY